VVAINRFPTDTDAELRLIESLAIQAGAARVARVESFARGGEGALELADAVIEACEEKSQFRSLYSLDLSYEAKLETIAKQVYGASGIEVSPDVRALLAGFESKGYGGLPICVAKTQYSLSHDPKLLGRPNGFVVPIKEVRLCAGAGFVLATCEGITLMPGLPKNPAARQLDIGPNGEIVGLKTE
jgi:formyltetrahydrofolate synthetase